MPNPEFLKEKYNLHNAPEVKRAAERAETRTGEKVPQDPEARIQNYLDRFKEIIERKNPEERERGIQALKKILIDKFVTKFEEISESWHALNERILRERGQGGDWNQYSPEQKEKERRQQAEAVLADQEASLEQWVDYMTSPNSSYMPDYIKYWTFRSITDLAEYDKEKSEFPKRSKGTVKMFPDINHEALAYVIDAVIKKHEGKEFKFEQFEADLTVEQKEAFKKSLTAENFAKLYAWANEQIHPIAKHLLPVTEGQWIKYGQDSGKSENYKQLNQSIRGKGTGWCTAGENTAKTQLQGGDFYVFYSFDDDKQPTIPRIAIRMESDKIAEVRGIANKQNLDPYMGDVLSEKLEEFPDKNQYLKKDADMKLLTAVESKIKKGEELAKNDLIFLYEINSPIEGFGYQKDPRVVELRQGRNTEDDMLIIFECTKDQIAHNPQEITENTKAYIGEWNMNVFQIIRNYPTIKHLYESFPEKKIFMQTLETDPAINTPEKAEKAIEDKNMYLSDWGRNILYKTEFSKEGETYNLVGFTVGQLGFPSGATTNEIYERVEELGLELCPAEVGSHLRLQYPGGEWMFITMKQIVGRGGDPDVFGLDRDEAQLALRALRAKPTSRWDEDDGFVFCSRK